VVHNQQKADGSMPVNLWLICAVGAKPIPHSATSLNKNTPTMGYFYLKILQYVILYHTTPVGGSKFVYKNKRQ